MYLTPLWTNYFIKGTTTLLRFGVDKINEGKPSVNCNYFLLYLILKDFDKEKYIKYNKTAPISDYNIQIKEELIEAYKALMNEDNFRHIFAKMQKDGKQEEVKNLQQSKNYLNRLEILINSETYRLTIIDFVIFMTYYKIPILLVYQTKKTKGNDGAKLFYMMKSDFYYIIKIKKQKYPNNKTYILFMLHLWTNRINAKGSNKMTTFKFLKNTTFMKPKLLEDIRQRNIQGKRLYKYNLSTYLGSREF